MSTAVVTDTNSGIYEAEGKELGIHVVPMPIVAGETTYYEGLTITHEEFFDLLRSGTTVRTSQPAPGSVTDVWDSVLKEYDDLVYIPMSSGLTGSVQTAKILAEDYNGRVQVADNHRISVTQRHSVMDALTMAESGMNAGQIKNILEQTAYESIVFIAVEDLSYLKRGGRITPAVAAIGSILNIKPLMVIRGEKLDQYATVRGTKHCRKRSVDALHEEAQKLKSKGFSIRIGAAGSFADPADGEAWADQIREAFPGEEVRYDPLSYSIACHTGPEAFGCGVSLVYER